MLPTSQYHLTVWNESSYSWQTKYSLTRNAYFSERFPPTLTVITWPRLTRWRSWLMTFNPKPSSCFCIWMSSLIRAWIEIKLTKKTPIRMHQRCPRSVLVQVLPADRNLVFSKLVHKGNKLARCLRSKYQTGHSIPHEWCAPLTVSFVNENSNVMKRAH